ncbi:MAG: hypothetical protein HQK55_13950 [Deltaproteobacteria bacterium]|nr:hypothetical protein [Deltaproteobacteria bacterium]
MINCTKCRQPLSGDVFSPVDLVECQTCGARLRVDAFPAMLTSRTTIKLDDSFVFDDEATCFFHPRKKAAVSCSSCGRFICRLCDVELDGQHLCPTCLDTGKRNHLINNLVNKRTLFDSLALYLALLPIIFVWPTIITAPMAIYVGIRYWKAPTSIVPRRKWRNWVAVGVASLQIIVWVMVLFKAID